MKILGAIYKFLKKIYIIKLLKTFRYISFNLKKHDFEYYEDQCIVRVFIGTYGGYSILCGNYYININRRIFICNYYHLLNDKGYALDDICIDSDGVKIRLYSLFESIILENDKQNYQFNKYQKVESASYSLIKKNNPNKNIVINKHGGFFHFYIEVIPILLRHLTDNNNLYFITGNSPFYKSILKYYSIEYVENCEYPKRDIYEYAMPNYYPFSKEIQEFRKFNLKTFALKDNNSFKLYITRKNENARRIINEDILIEKLINLGFIILDPGTLDYAEQVKYFRNASIIIAAHGAALSNIIWCNKNVKIIELNGNHDVRWHFAKISVLLGFNYKLILGNTIDELYFIVNISRIEKFI